MSTEDRLAIIEMIARYSYAWDELDADAYAALFTEDAVFQTDPQLAHGPVIDNQGRDAIYEWASSRIAKRDRSRLQTRHIQTGTIFDELTDSTASTRTMLLTTRHGPDAGPATSGVYYDEWRKTLEGWRLSRRTLRHDFP